MSFVYSGSCTKVLKLQEFAELMQGLQFGRYIHNEIYLFNLNEND